MRPIIDWQFAKEETQTFDSPQYINIKGDSMTIQISGTYTSGSFVVEGKTDFENGPYVPLALISISDLKIYRNGIVTEKGAYYADISGMHNIRVRSTALSGGNVTILGRIVED